MSTARAFGVSIGIGGVAALVMPMVIRSIIPAAAPVPDEPHVSVSQAYCTVSPDNTRAVILDAGTRDVLLELREGTREGAVLTGDALTDGTTARGTLSVAFDEKNRALKCVHETENEATTYAISWRGGYNFAAR